MGWVTMSERDPQRIEVLTDVLAGRQTVAAAATVLAVSERQLYRLLAKYEDGGGSVLIHRARGRTSNRTLNAGIRKYAIELVRTRYADFGPILATEILLEKHDLRVGRETLRRWMVADGLWLSRLGSLKMADAIGIIGTERLNARFSDCSSCFPGE
jgi:transposase